MCNIEGLEGLDGALSSGAEGIGLFRTEFLALQNFGDEENKARIYEEVARRAFELLHERLTKNSIPRRLCVVPRVIRRESV